MSRVTSTRIAVLCLVAASLLAGCAPPPRAQQAQPAQPAPAVATPSKPAAAELGELVRPITFFSPSEGYDSQQYEANRLMVDIWEKELGLKVNMQLFADFSTISAALGSEKGKEADVFSYGFVGRVDRLDPDELLSRPFLCKSNANYGAYCNPEYDQVVNASKMEYDTQKRRELVFKAQEFLARDLPAMATYHPFQSSVYNKERFKNVILAAGAGIHNTWALTDSEPTAANTERTLRYSTANVIRSVHPMLHSAAGPDASSLTAVVYDSLTRLGPDGGVVPWLATSWTSIDDKTVRVTLRSGHRFHDGTPVTAEDVKFSYDYLKKWQIGYYQNPLKPIQEVAVLNPTTVEFRLAQPSATLLGNSLGQIPIIPKHIWDGVVERLRLTHPRDWQEASNVGSGPFKFVTHQRGVGVRLEKNPNHWAPPKVDFYEVREFPDLRSSFNAFVAGTVDFIRPDELGAAELIQVKKLKHAEVKDHSSITVRFVAFNLRDGSPFQDYRFRQAIAHTPDYKTIVEVIMQGYGQPGKGFIAPGNEFWHNPKAAYPPFDPTKAKQILKEAGYGWDTQGRLHYPKNFKAQMLP